VIKLPRIPIKGNHIHYLIGDDFNKSRPTVVMIHGAAQSTATWEYQIDALKDHEKFNLIIIDLPGHGRSVGISFRRIMDYSEFLKHFCDELNLKKLILVGHSMGGGIAQILTLNHPNRVCALVLVGTGSRLRVAKETLTAVKYDYETFCEVAPSRAFPEHSAEELKEKFKQGLLTTPQEVSYQDLVACDEFDVMNDVKEIGVPTLIISGDQDILAPVKYGKYLANQIEGAKLHIIKKAGHYMMQEKPEEFNRVLLNFLESLD